MNGKYQHIRHEFEPVYDSSSRILILGDALPSVKSREQQFYYGHPQNRFWKVFGESLRFGEDAGDDFREKRISVAVPYRRVGRDCRVRYYRFQVTAPLKM